MGVRFAWAVWERVPERARGFVRPALAGFRRRMRKHTPLPEGPVPSLPPEVQRVGVTVKKVSSAFLMAIGLVASDNRYDALFLNNYAQINLVNQVGSLAGVGESRASREF